MQRPMKAVSLIKLKDLLTRDYIPFLGGRPKRDNVINVDEITNLKIDLWTTDSVDEFLRNQGIKG